MPYTIQSPFRSSPRMSEDTFVGILKASGSLAAIPLWRGLADTYDTTEDAARAVYRFIVSKGHDPASWLAICAREHRYGLDQNSVLWRNDTRSLTNARTVRDPLLKRRATVITDAVRRSGYVKYANVIDSVQDGIYRVDDPTYAYAGKTTLEEIFSVWTEDPEDYATFVAEWLNANADMEGEPPMAVPIIRRILPRNASNTPQRTMQWEWITVHNTANPKAGADALMHASWLESLAKAGAEEPSWGYTVDAERIVQHLEDDQAGWHASDGNGDGNMKSLGYELVEVGDQNKVMANAAWHIAGKLRSKGYGIDRVKQHYDWARDRKDCPRLLRANGGAGWKRLIAMIATELQQGSAPKPTPDKWIIPGNPFGQFGFVAGFRDTVEKLARAKYPQDMNAAALSIVGYAMEDETPLPDNRARQRCERATLIYDGKASAPWDIVFWMFDRSEVE